MITADHKARNEEQESRLHYRVAVVVQELATHWVQRVTCKTNSAQQTQRNLRKFIRPEENPRSINTVTLEFFDESLRRAELET